MNEILSQLGTIHPDPRLLLITVGFWKWNPQHKIKCFTRSKWWTIYVKLHDSVVELANFVGQEVMIKILQQQCLHKSQIYNNALILTCYYFYGNSSGQGDIHGIKNVLKFITDMVKFSVDVF